MSWQLQPSFLPSTNGENHGFRTLHNRLAMLQRMDGKDGQAVADSLQDTALDFPDSLREPARRLTFYFLYMYLMERIENKY